MIAILWGVGTVLAIGGGCWFMFFSEIRQLCFAEARLMEHGEFSDEEEYMRTFCIAHPEWDANAAQKQRYFALIIMGIGTVILLCLTINLFL